MAGYESHQWFEFGVAIVGAAAVLSGLLFVAMSINIERIMAIVTLPARAAGRLVLFVIPLMVRFGVNSAPTFGSTRRQYAECCASQSSCRQPQSTPRGGGSAS